jgi:hypothetical protein
MPISNRTFETSLDLQKTREVVLQALATLGYKVVEDSQTKIVSKHSFGARYYPHDLEINLLSQPDKTMINASIDHFGSKVYLDRLSKELGKKLVL